MSKINITFEYDNKTIRDSLDLGTFGSDEGSENYLLNVRHNSNKPIRQCKFYVTPYDKIYNGSNSASDDFKKLIWYADNYENYGLSLYQEYTVLGEVYIQEAGRLIDITRTEETDFFKGSKIEILSGPLTGEKQEILGFDPQNNMFLLAGDFPGPVNGETYKIEIKKNDYIKKMSGTSPDFGIPLLFNGGKIDRFEAAPVTLRLRIPPFMKSPGISLFNLNMSYTPEE